LWIKILIQIQTQPQPQTQARTAIFNYLQLSRLTKLFQQLNQLVRRLAMLSREPTYKAQLIIFFTLTSSNLNQHLKTIQMLQHLLKQLLIHQTQLQILQPKVMLINGLWSDRYNKLFKIHQHKQQQIQQMMILPLQTLSWIQIQVKQNLLKWIFLLQLSSL
jgi:hypothetical protein